MSKFCDLALKTDRQKDGQMGGWMNKAKFIGHCH